MANVKFILPCLWLFLSGCGVMEGTDQAEFEVERFHLRYNSGQYQEIYRRSHDEFKGFISSSQLTTILEKLTHTLGRHKTSTLINWSAKSSFIGKGSKITLVYAATYERSESVKETFTFYKKDSMLQLYNFNVSAAEFQPESKKSYIPTKQTET